MNVTLLCLQDTALRIGILPKVRLLKQVRVAHHARIGNSRGLLIGWTSTPPQPLQKHFSKNCNVGDTYSSVGYDFQGPCVPGIRCEARGYRTRGSFSNIDRQGRSTRSKNSPKISKNLQTHRLKRLRWWKPQIRFGSR